MALCYGARDMPRENPLAIMALAVIVVFVATVIPWLIWKMIRQAYDDLFGSKPVDGDTRSIQLPDHSVARAGTASDFRPRIGDRL